MSFNKGKKLLQVTWGREKASTEEIEKAYKVLFNEFNKNSKSTDKHQEGIDKFEDVRKAYNNKRR